MAATLEFTEEPQASQWLNTYEAYKLVLQAKCSKKSKAAAGKELLQLDEW